MAAVSCLQISQESSFGARVYDTVHRAHRILPLSVSVQGQRCRLVVGRLEHELPPYRIENRCGPMHSSSATLLKAHRMSECCHISGLQLTYINILGFNAAWLM